MFSVTQFVHEVTEVPLPLCVSVYFINPRCIKPAVTHPCASLCWIPGSGLALCCARHNPSPASVGALQHLCAGMQE